jgi:hypothetical protein
LRMRGGEGREVEDSGRSWGRAVGFSVAGRQEAC